MAGEIWKTIDNFPTYLISDKGRVQNKNTGRILSQGDDGGGYKCIGLRRDGKSYTMKIHRLVGMTFVPGYREGFEINHIDGDKSNNNALNLEWVNRSRNMFHAQDTGLWDVRRAVRVVETGDVYRSETECANAIGGDVGHVQQCAAGLRKTHRGFHYEFVSDN